MIVDNTILDVKEIKHGRWPKRKRGYLVILNPIFIPALTQIDQSLKKFFPKQDFYYFVSPIANQEPIKSLKHLYT